MEIHRVRWMQAQLMLSVYIKIDLVQCRWTVCTILVLSLNGCALYNVCVHVWVHVLLYMTHHVHVHIEWEVLWSSGLVLGQVLDKLCLLGYKTGSKQLVTTELVGVEAIQEENPTDKFRV